MFSAPFSAPFSKCVCVVGCFYLIQSDQGSVAKSVRDCGQSRGPAEPGHGLGTGRPKVTLQALKALEFPHGIITFGTLFPLILVWFHVFFSQKCSMIPTLVNLLFTLSVCVGSVQVVGPLPRLKLVKTNVY